MQQLATVLWGTLTLPLINKQVQKPGNSLEHNHLEMCDKLEVLSPHSVEELWFWHVCCRTEDWYPGDYQRRRRKNTNTLCIVTSQVKLNWELAETKVVSLHIIHMVREQYAAEQCVSLLGCCSLISLTESPSSKTLNTYMNMAGE